MTDKKRPFFDLSFIYRLRFKKDYYAFSICLLLATLFWLLNALSKDDYKTIIRIPVKYVNLPANLSVMNRLPSSLSFEVTADGYSLLLQYLKSGKDTIIIPAEELQKRKKGNRQQAFLSTKKVFGKIASQLTHGVEVTRILTDSIYFDFDRKITRLVSVKLDTSLSFHPQYLLAGDIELKPTAVNVTGPGSVIDTITEIITKHLQFDDLSGNITTNVSFDLPPGDTSIKVKPNKVLVMVPVDKFTESSIKLPVKTLNLPDSFKIKLFPDSVEVFYNVALSKFDKVQAELFTANVDFSTSDGMKAQTLQVKINHFYVFVKLIRFSPNKL